MLNETQSRRLDDLVMGMATLMRVTLADMIEEVARETDVTALAHVSGVLAGTELGELTAQMHAEREVTKECASRLAERLLNPHKTL